MHEILFIPKCLVASYASIVRTRSCHRCSGFAFRPATIGCPGPQRQEKTWRSCPANEKNAHVSEPHLDFQETTCCSRVVLSVPVLLDICLLIFLWIKKTLHEHVHTTGLHFVTVTLLFCGWRPLELASQSKKNKHVYQVLVWMLQHANESPVSSMIVIRFHTCYQTKNDMTLFTPIDGHLRRIAL